MDTVTSPATATVTTRLAVLAVGALTLAVPAIAQDHEPMRLTSQNRGLWVDIEDPFLGVETYHASTDQPGGWAESGERAEPGAQGTAYQWTRIDEDFIGGYLSSSMYAFGGFQRNAGGSMWARFEVERTGRLNLVAAVQGHFSNDFGESMALVQLNRLDGNGDFEESVFNWAQAGENGDEVDTTETLTTYLRPGRYVMWANVRTDVHGVDLQPDLADLTLFASAELDRLPGCGEPGAGSCSEAKETPSCDDATCCTRICEIDPYCCDNRWDAVCVDRAAEGCGPCRGDLNGDGVVDGADQGLLFAAWGVQSPTFVHPADFNADGMVDGVDLGTLFSHWGDC